MSSLSGYRLDGKWLKCLSWTQYPNCKCDDIRQKTFFLKDSEERRALYIDLHTWGGGGWVGRGCNSPPPLKETGPVRLCRQTSDLSYDKTISER